MQRLVQIIIASVFLFLTLHQVMGQELSASDREKLTRAERTADEFVARFKKTFEIGNIERLYKDEREISNHGTRN